MAKKKKNYNTPPFEIIKIGDHFCAILSVILNIQWTVTTLSPDLTLSTFLSIAPYISLQVSLFNKGEKRVEKRVLERVNKTLKLYN